MRPVRRLRIAWMFARLSSGSGPGAMPAWYWKTLVEGSGQRLTRPSSCRHMCQTSRLRPSTSISATIIRTVFEGLALERDTSLLTDDAVAAVAADQPARAVTVSASPPLTTTADTPSSDCSKLSSAVPNSTAPPSSASRSLSASSIRHSGVIRLAVYGMSGRSLNASGAAPPSVSWPSGAVERIGIAIRPLAITRLTMPRSPNTSRVRGWMPLPR